MTYKNKFLLITVLFVITQSAYSQANNIATAIQSNPPLNELNNMINIMYNGLYPALTNNDQKAFASQQQAWLHKQDSDFNNLLHSSNKTDKANAYLFLEQRYLKRLGSLEEWISAVNISGLLHVQNIGDILLNKNQWAGTQNRSLRVEAIMINMNTPPAFLSLQYMCHIQDIGNTPWLNEGTLCGTRGKSKRLEGFAIQLTGRAASYFTVKYQCRPEGASDSIIFQDGQFCGTHGQSRALEAMKLWIEKRQN